MSYGEKHRNKLNCLYFNSITSASFLINEKKDALRMKIQWQKWHNVLLDDTRQMEIISYKKQILFLIFILKVSLIKPWLCHVATKYLISISFHFSFLITIFIPHRRYWLKLYSKIVPSTERCLNFHLKD